MKKYSKANSMAHWRTSIGKHELRKTRKQTPSFAERQSYVEAQGMSIAAKENKQAENKLPKMPPYQQARFKKESRKLKAQIRREHHQAHEFRLLMLLGTLMMLAGSVSANRRNNLGHQVHPASESLIRRYRPAEVANLHFPDVTEEFKRDLQPSELFHPLSTMPETPVKHRLYTNLKTRSILGKAEEAYERELRLLTRFQTPLHKACQDNNLEAVRVLLSKGADFTVKNKEGKTAFDIACEQDALAIVRLLLEFGYDPETAVEMDLDSGLPITDLFLAVHHNNYKLAHILLEYGKARPSRALIKIAEKNRNLEMKELLQAHLFESSPKTDARGVRTVAEVSTVRFYGKEKFNQVNQAIFDDSPKLLRSGLNIQLERGNKGACIYETYFDENLQKLKLEHWTFENSESYEFCLAIFLESYQDMVRLFPTVDRDYRLPRGYNWMMVSASADDARLPNFFLHQGFDVNHKAVLGQTALHCFAANSESRSIPNYIAAGADVNAQDNYGTTPLMAAVMCKNRRQVIELLMGGADLSVRNFHGQDAWALARAYKWHEILNEIVSSLCKMPLSVPLSMSLPKTSKTCKDFSDDSWLPQYGAVLAGTVLVFLSAAYYLYRQRPQVQAQSIPSKPLVKPKRETTVVARDKAKITASKPTIALPVAPLVIEPNAETVREKVRVDLDYIESAFKEKGEETYPQEANMKIAQTRVLNKLSSVRKRVQSLDMEGQCERVFSKVDKDIGLLADCMDAMSKCSSSEHRQTYERLRMALREPKLSYDALEELCRQSKTLCQEVNEEKAVFLEKQKQAQQAIKRIERNLEDLSEEITRIEEKREQISLQQQDKKSKQQTQKVQKELDKKKWAEKKEQIKLSKKEEKAEIKEKETKGNKGKEKKKEKISSKRRGKEPEIEKPKKWAVYLATLRSDVDLLENTLDRDKIDLYLSDPKILFQYQFYGSCYYVMRIFHRLSKMHKFGLGNYAPCSADEAMGIRNAIMHEYERWFSNPDQMIAIAREVVKKLRHTLDALARGEPAQKMDISIHLPGDSRYSRIETLDRLYEDYLRVSDEAMRLVEDGKYDFSQPFHGILKAFNFMLGQVLKDFGILDNPFSAHRNDIAHCFDTGDDTGLSEEINCQALFALCKKPLLKELTDLVNDCQQRAGVNLAVSTQDAASSSSQSSAKEGDFPRFFAHRERARSSMTQISSSIAKEHRASKH